MLATGSLAAVIVAAPFHWHEIQTATAALAHTTSCNDVTIDHCVVSPDTHRASSSYHSLPFIQPGVNYTQAQLLS